jgi:hypothetical protein
MTRQPFRLGTGGNILGGPMSSVRSLYGAAAPTPLNNAQSGRPTGTPTFNPNYVNGPLVGMRPQPTGGLGGLAGLGGGNPFVTMGEGGYNSPANKQIGNPAMVSSTASSGKPMGIPTFNPNYVNGPLIGWNQPTGLGGVRPGAQPQGIPPHLLALLNKPGWVDGPMIGNQRPATSQSPFSTSLQNLFSRFGRR